MLKLTREKKTRRKTVGIQKREKKRAKKGGNKATVNNPNVFNDGMKVIANVAQKTRTQE
jgi:hypothetical protein